MGAGKKCASPVSGSDEGGVRDEKGSESLPFVIAGARSGLVTTHARSSFSGCSTLDVQMFKAGCSNE